MLRTFDATARQGSFVVAGRVLNVTHSAVTRQVRALEGELGLALVRRAGRTVALTRGLRRACPRLGRGLGPGR